MPVIPATKITSIGAVAATETTLDGTDSFVYVPGVSGSGLSAILASV